MAGGTWRRWAHLDVGPLLAHLVGAAEASRAGADDDDVGLSVAVHVLEVARGHGAGDLHMVNKQRDQGTGGAKGVYGLSPTW